MSDTESELKIHKNLNEEDSSPQFSLNDNSTEIKLIKTELHKAPSPKKKFDK